MKVLIIGSGGREHCLAWKIAASDMVEEIYAIPGNAGISGIANCIDMGIAADDFKKIADIAESEGIGMTIVGPEAPLVDGISDYFESRSLVTFGPSKNASMIEGSKVFTKNFLNKYGIPTAKAKVFEKSEYGAAKAFIKKQNKFPLVIKADGLAAGKGVMIAADMSEAIQALDDCMAARIFGSAGDRVMIEEFLEGYEISILCLSDGKKIIPMELAQDYKRIFEGDEGKNTGGMGSYSPVPMIDKKIYKKALDTIIYPTSDALKKEGIDYRGIIYAGILVSGGEPYLLEYNCRFGDPETQAVLPRLKDDLAPLLYECARGSLSVDSLSWHKDKCICVVAASRGYPETSSKGDIITGLEKLKSMQGIEVFHAGTKIEDSNIVTNGGRVLGITARAPGFKLARQKVYNGMEKIKFDGMQYRKDIAKKAEGDS
ncbi:MAG TPA: phosphoribosylamine--glycine ligase [Actinobacteria bacterium]|nr:phosphoribosylamine--glycine ligase [Actinomycetota bacterium]